MPSKKAHKPRDPRKGGSHNIQPPSGRGRKSTGQTKGQFRRDPKGRKGQYGGGGDSPLIKK